MAGQARDLQMTAGCETSAIVTARACPAPPRLLAQALSGSLPLCRAAFAQVAADRQG
jgi:hypothetical protein